MHYGISDNIFYGMVCYQLEQKHKNNTNSKYINTFEIDTKTSKQLWNNRSKLVFVYFWDGTALLKLYLCVSITWCLYRGHTLKGIALMPQLVKYFASSPKPIQKPADTCNLKDVETESTCQSSKSMRSCLKEKESSWKPTTKTVLWLPQVHAHRTTTYTSRHTHATKKKSKGLKKKLY